jgi:hypothetical protein
MKQPMPANERPRESLARDAGLRAPDAVANPEIVRQSRMDLRVLRRTPLYVAAVAAAFVGAIGLLVLTVL